MDKKGSLDEGKGTFSNYGKTHRLKFEILTGGYLCGLEKQVDLCTLLYHHAAHTPSYSFGPASHPLIHIL